MIKKYVFVWLFVAVGLGSGYGQHSEIISTIDFVRIINDRTEEVRYYYENNWKVLRAEAVNRGFIHSYDIVTCPENENPNCDLLLITTYADQAQYDQREENFGLLIRERGSVRLLNELKPGEFRENVFSLDGVRHWNK